MIRILFILLFTYSITVFPLEIEGLINAELKGLYLYNGSRMDIAPEDGVTIYVKGKANKKVKLKIKTNGVIYLTQGVRIENLRARKPIIILDKYGEGHFDIGFSLIGERRVSGKHKKQIKYEIEYVN